MGKIRILQEEVYKKIAAGEVVERPVSVVKELVENALDAGAKKIEVEIIDGGKELIKVADNGHGFAPEDIAIAFERHSTSKFSQISDFNHLHTLGFRGEALPSIAEVANIDLKTADNSKGMGKHCLFKQGLMKWQKEIAHNRGTTIEVQNLFFNFPVRKKFLKSERTETRQIISYIEQIALVHYPCCFVLTNNHKRILECGNVDSLKERIYQLFGKDFLDSLTPIKSEEDAYALYGYISKLNRGISLKKHQYFFVNQRPVREKTLISSLNNTFRQYLEKHTHPQAVLVFTIPANEIDVNIHPMKLEIKFQHSNHIYQFLKSAIENTFRNDPNWINKTAYPAYADPRPNMPTNHFTTREANDDLPHLFPEQDLVQDQFVLIGQFKHSYIIIEKEESLLVIDQHNAQERITFEALKKQYNSGKITAISPLFPIIIELTPSEKAKLTASKKSLLHDIGFQIHPLSGNSFEVKRFPQVLEEKKIREAILSILYFDQKEVNLEDKVLAEIACKSSIKINRPLHPEQMKQIVRDLFRTENPYFCPHQRPIVIDISLQEIEKRLRRK